MEQPLWKYKGKEYYIESMATLKDPTTRKWVGCFIYISVETGHRYVREQGDFNKKFKAV